MDNHEKQACLISALKSGNVSVPFLKDMESGKIDGWYLEEGEAEDQEDS